MYLRTRRVIPGIAAMSSSWTERQGLVGDLRNKSKDELYDILLRQEKLLSNKRFIHTLPDTGKKISEFAERVRQALAHVEEAERKQKDLSTVRTDFQAQYQQALTQRQPQPRSTAPVQSLPERGPGENRLPEPKHVDQPKEAELTPHSTSGSHDRDDGAQQQSPNATETMETTPDGEHGTPREGDESKGGALAEALARVSLSDPAGEKASGSSGGSSSGGLRNPFLVRQPLKKMHYVEVLERTERTVSTLRPKFKPNQLSVSKSGSPSPSGSPGGVSPLSLEARRQRDRKHMDEITSARLAPLHYDPAKLLSLEEASGLMREQTQRQRELEARMAAQKLSESLSSSMRSYHPEGGSLGPYREVRDDGASDEDD